MGAIVALKPKEKDESNVANASFIGVVSFNVKNVIATSKSAHANEVAQDDIIFKSEKILFFETKQTFEKKSSNIVPKIQHIPPEEKPFQGCSEPATFPKVFSVKFQYLV